MFKIFKSRKEKAKKTSSSKTDRDYGHVVGIRISDELYVKLQIKAAERGIKLSTLIKKAIIKELDEKGAEING